jgi:hypothetical protein
MYPLNGEPHCADFFPRKDDALFKMFRLITQEMTLSLREELISGFLE